MIRLDNINIQFNHKLIENSTITIPDNCVTAISGKSGCGKTSLLYLIGLIATNTDYQYNFDGLNVNLNSDYEISQLRKSRIGYIFQDNSLVESLSIGDNIKFSARIAGRKLSDEELSQYLAQVKLTTDIDKYPRVLSGGERQRLAIACAMAKQPDLIVADEPTSELDAENSRIIMSILKNYAAENNNKVVIASHDPIYKEYADLVYEIKDKKIVKLSADGEEQKQKLNRTVEKNKFSFVDSLKYASKSMKRSKLQKTVMVILCAIAIAMAACVGGIGDGLVKHQETLLKSISDREIFLINFTAPMQSFVDTDEHSSMSKSDIDKIKKINSIDSFYPYLEFRSVGYDLINDTAFDTSNVTVNINGNEKNYIFTTAEESEYKTLIIAPYYPEDNIEKRVESNFSSESQEKAYISHHLADLLEISNPPNSQLKIHLNIGVPLATTDIELHTETSNSTYEGDVDMSRVIDMEINLAGILDQNYVNSHSSSSHSVIYLPLQTMLDYKNELKENTDPSYFQKDFPVNEWMPSAYVTFVKDFNDIGVTIDKLESINPNFKAISGYQDVESMNMMLTGVKSTASWIIAAVLIIVAILMAILYINDTIARKYEFAIIKANGLNKKETLKITFSEAIIHLGGIIILASIVAIIISMIVNALFNFDLIKFGAKTILIIIATAILTVLVPTIASVIVMNRVQPDQVLRT